MAECLAMDYQGGIVAAVSLACGDELFNRKSILEIKNALARQCFDLRNKYPKKEQNRQCALEAAIFIYCFESDFYRFLNQRLRNFHQNKDKLELWIPYINLLTTAVDALCPKWSGKLFRGMDFADREQKLRYSDFGFSSFSKKAHIAKSFADKGPKTLEFTIIELEVSESAFCFDISKFSPYSEEEILFLPGQVLGKD
jgi:hypothetical protein